MLVLFYIFLIDFNRIEDNLKCNKLYYWRLNYYWRFNKLRGMYYFLNRLVLINIYKMF